MPNFEYSGRSAQGLLTKGRAEANTIDAMAAQLLERGITPVDIRPVTESDKTELKLKIMFGAERVSTVELIMFCRQMYTITRAGIPLTRGLRGLAASMRHPMFASTLNEIAGRLEAGMTLSAALSRYPKIFNHLFVNLVGVGESTGQLDAVFQQLAYYMERDETTKKSIKSATRYPMFVGIAMLIAIAVVNVAVIPKFADLFAGMGTELPLVTRFLIAFSNLFVNHWWALLLGGGAAVGGFLYYIKTPAGALFWGAKKLKLPVMGDLIERASMARYARSFSLMLKAGVPLNQALTLCSRAIDNPYLAAKIDGIRKGVERGESLLRTHSASEMFSPLVIQMIAVGEESGQVEQLLAEVAGFYEREVDYDLKKMSDKIEPIMIISMAGFVTVLALGIFLPMWGMYENSGM